VKTLRSFGGRLWEAFSAWQEDGAPRLGAALAYYTLFSVAPLLLIAIAVAGFVFGRDAALGRIVAELQSIVGHDAARTVQDLIEKSRRPEAGVVAALAALATLFLGATGVFVELKSALNAIWGAESPRVTVAGLVRGRLAAFALVLAVGFLLLVSLVVSAGLSALGAVFARYLADTATVLQALNVAVSLAVITALFALLFKYLPDVPVAWRDVWLGAAVAALLFTAGKFLIGLYLGRSTVASTYGAAASIVVLMIWVYYAAQIFFYGAELTKVSARRHARSL
jgi:membrane protein